MRIKAVSSGLCLGVFWASVIAAQDAPLSVIDWLDQTAVAPAQPVEPPVSQSGGVPTISVSSLDSPGIRATGIVPSDVTGLPVTLWEKSRVETVAAAFKGIDVPSLPALQSLLYSLVLTEALPPSGPERAFQLARIKVLEAHGALDPALAFVQNLEAEQDPVLFSKLFDLSLIAGDENAVCDKMLAVPTLAPDKGAEVFCQARSGDWATATLLFGTADALSLLEPARADALARFLDPELFEGEAPLPEPQAADALMFRLFEALGQRLPTQGLPRVFAHADLSDTAGWKSQLEAAERLASTGAIPENRLLGLYSDRRPAASGGIWDRVLAVQQFETALKTRSPDAVTKTLPSAWSAARSAGFETRFAALFAEPLQSVTLSGAAADLAFQIALLSPDYQQAPFSYPVRARADKVLTGIALAKLGGLSGANTRQKAIVAGLTDKAAPLDTGLGLALLGAIADIEAGAAGDVARLRLGLSQLQAAGLQDTARRAALQVLLLRDAP